MRECGLSEAKAACILDLARKQTSGLLDIESMGSLDDDQVIAALTAVRGIGVWSAQAFLIRQLHRPDVLPAGDLGIRRAIGAAWKTKTLPGVNDVRAQAAAWSPYRTYAAALLWRSLALPGELSDPKARALDRETRRKSAR